MSARATRPPSYLARLLAELDEIHDGYAKVLSASAIRNVDPNRHGSGVAFIGFPSWGWEESDAALEASRMALLRQVRDWGPRFRLLFPHPVPTVSKRLDEHLGRLERWLVREPGDHSIPPPSARQPIRSAPAWPTSATSPSCSRPTSTPCASPPTPTP